VALADHFAAPGVQEFTGIYIETAVRYPRPLKACGFAYDLLGLAEDHVSKILLVDDERDYITTLAERLEMRDMRSDVAFDGEQALSRIRAGDYDIMVLDLRMPGISGHEVLRRVRKLRPHVQVIVVSGHGNENDEELARELGAFEYLNKPVELTDLAAVMLRAVARAQEERSRRPSPPLDRLLTQNNPE